jgi:hypothetical protein
MVAHACHPSYSRSINRSIVDKAGLGINARSYIKNNQSKIGWGHGSMVECLLCKHKAPSSKPQYCQKKVNQLNRPSMTEMTELMDKHSKIPF